MFVKMVDKSDYLKVFIKIKLFTIVNILFQK
jgi:hypothetical protein